MFPLHENLPSEADFYLSQENCSYMEREIRMLDQTNEFLAGFTTRKQGRVRQEYSLNELRLVMYRYFRIHNVTQWDVDFDSNAHEFILTTDTIKNFRIPAGNWIYRETTW